MSCLKSRKGRPIGRPFFCVTMMAAMAQIPTAGRAATQGYSITSFDNVRLEAPVRVEIVTGGGVTARGEGDRDMLDRVDMQVSGRSLVVRLRRTDGSAGRKGGGPLLLKLSTDSIARAMVMGGGILAIDRIRGQRADLGVTGDGEMKVGVLAVDRLRALMAGGGRMILAGKAGQVDIRIIGPGAIDAEALSGRDVVATNNGAGSLRLSAVTSANIVATGSGDTTVLGTPACTVKQAGSGRVACAGREY